jgi:hypothetical protein
MQLSATRRDSGTVRNLTAPGLYYAGFSAYFKDDQSSRQSSVYFLGDVTYHRTAYKYVRITRVDEITWNIPKNSIGGP